MARIMVWAGLWAGFFTAPAGAATLTRYEFTGTEMAVPFRFVFYAADADTANRAAEAAFARLHQLNQILSDYDESSELRRLGASAVGGKSVAVSPELWEVLQAAQEISERSEGAFDVTVGPLVRLWRRARRTHELPKAVRLEQARQLVDYRLIHFDPEHQSIALGKSDMRLDVGGIAKGYAIDQVLSELRKFGITRALIHAGGDQGLGDPPPGETGWRIGVGLLEHDARPSQFLSLARCAVANSGDMYQFVEIGGRRYSHLVDPRTGLGLTDHSNVTVIAPMGILSDGLSSAVSVLGPEAGMKLIEATPGTAALILRAPEGRVERYASTRWNDLPEAALPAEPPAAETSR